jgi:outer membrane protein with beta-barrel domain
MDRSRKIHGWPLLLQITWLCLAVFTEPAGAQEPRFEVFAGIQPPGFIHSENSTRLAPPHQYRLGLRYAWRPAISTELSAMYGPDSTVATADGAILYHFRSNSKWTAFFGGGLHYASISYEVDHQGLEDEEHGTAVVVIGGVDWQFSRLVGIRFEARGRPLKLTGYHENIDDSVVSSMGLTLRF